MKTKKLLLTLVIILTAFITKAQDKYEFMTIVYTAFESEITISINGNQFLKEEVVREKGRNGMNNANPFLKKLSEYQDNNWEVMTVDIALYGPYGYIAYNAVLKKKK